MAAKDWQHKYREPGAAMDLTEHLDELRDRIIWSLAALFLGVFAVGVPLAGPALRLIERPFRNVGEMGNQQVVVLEYAADGTLRAAEESRPLLEKALIPGEVGDEARAVIHPSRVMLRGPQGGEFSWGLDPGHSLFFFTPLEPVVIYMKIMLLVGVLAAFPVILWNVWAFISPGLTESERTFTARSLQAAMLLFPIGMSFAWFFMTYAMYFLMQYAGSYVAAIGVASYVNLTLLAMFLMGLVFELPLVILLLMRLDLVRREALQSHRAYVMVGLLVLSGIVTPPDPFTMVMMAAPLYVLFELTLIVSRIMGIGGTPEQDAADAGTPRLNVWWDKRPGDTQRPQLTLPAEGNGRHLGAPAALPAPEDEAVSLREPEE